MNQQGSSVSKRQCRKVPDLVKARYASERSQEEGGQGRNIQC